MVRSTVIRPIPQVASSRKLGFTPVRKTKVFEEVAKRLELLIIAEDFKPGDTIPPERELTKLFGVSRSSIREAIRTLALLGVVEPRQGTGTVVCRIPLRSHGPASAEDTRQHPPARDVLDARLAIEPPLARRAALQASQEDIRKLKQILSRQEHGFREGGPAPDEDLRFHYMIALAAKNDVMVKVVDVLIKALHKRREHRHPAGPEELQGHRRILAALARHDASEAERAMRRHLQEIEHQYS